MWVQMIALLDPGYYVYPLTTSNLGILITCTGYIDSGLQKEC